MIFEKTLIDNSKIRPFKALMFEDALNCSSCNKGYCSLKNICYAKRDAKKSKQHYLKTVEAANNLNKIMLDPELTIKFNQYIQINNYKVIRFNLTGDFKNVDNIEFLKQLAINNDNIKFYGYTKRKDLINELQDLIQLDNIYLNSDKKQIYNIKGVNQYKIHSNIKKYYNSNNKCGGVCSGCGYCYTLKNDKINTFIHSTPSHIQRALKTKNNINFMLDFINSNLNLSVDIEDMGGGMFVNSFIELLNNKGVQTPYKVNRKNEKIQLIKTVPELLKFIELQGLYNE